METRAQYVLIGLFTIIVAASAMLFGLWLAKSGTQQDYKQYDIVFNEAVSGLDVGNKVEYSGITVGEVRQLSLDEHDPRKVWARINVNAITPIKENTQARLALANITGTSNIQLTNGTPDSPALRADEGEIPIIVAQPSPFAQLTLNSSEILISMNELIAHAKQLLSTENIRHISTFLENMDSISTSIVTQKDDISQGLQDLASTGQQAKVAAAQAAQTMQQLNALIESHGSSIFGNAEETMTSLAHSSKALDQLLTSNAQEFSSGIKGFSELGAALREFRQTLSRLQNITRNLEENPTGYLLGGERIKEFQP
ncbi:MAG: MlaD family protein [Desulfuromonas sp.]|nr:MlaD family protein [Desulfuromonas sp.]